MRAFTGALKYILTLMHLHWSADAADAATRMTVHVQVVVHHQRRLHQAAAMVVQRQLMRQGAAQLCHSHIEFFGRDVAEERVVWGWVGD